MLVLLCAISNAVQTVRYHFLKTLYRLLVFFHKIFKFLFCFKIVRYYQDDDYVQQQQQSHIQYVTSHFQLLLKKIKKIPAKRHLNYELLQAREGLESMLIIKSSSTHL